MSHKIKLQNVGYKRIENGVTFHVLRGIDLEINPGDKVALIGVNGSGKTTLVKILSGELTAEPYDINKEIVARVGTFTVARGLSKKNRNASGVATVHQFVQDDLIDDLSVLKNICLRQRFAGVENDNLITAAKLGHDFEGYDVFNQIEPEKLVKNLSGGQKQLLNVLIALQYEFGSECGLLMLDEHLNALDVVARDDIENLINRFLDTVHPPTVIKVTHDLEMALRSDKIIALKKDKTASLHVVKELLKLNKQDDNEPAIKALKKIITDE
jgi:ABC-type multidrug transport system ATPase subunit